MTKIYVRWVSWCDINWLHSACPIYNIHHMNDCMLLPFVISIYIYIYIVLHCRISCHDTYNIILLYGGRTYSTNCVYCILHLHWIHEQTLMSVNMSYVHNCVPTLRDHTHVPARLAIDWKATANVKVGLHSGQFITHCSSRYTVSNYMQYIMYLVNSCCNP